MSGKVTGLVLEADLPKDEKAVLTALADHAHHDGTRVYPSTDKLIWMTGYERRSVQMALDKLEGKGILVCVQRGGRGPRTPTVWRIAIEKLPALPPFEVWFEARYGRPLGKGATVAPIDPEAAEEAAPSDAMGAENAPLESMGAENAPLAVTDEPKGAIYDTKGRNLRQLRAQSTTAKGAKSAPDPLCDPSVDPSENRCARARARPSPDRDEDVTTEPEPMSREPMSREPRLAHAYRTIPAAGPPSPSSARPPSPTAPHDDDLPTTIGATETRAVWREVIDQIHVSTPIKDWYFHPSRLFRLPDGSWLLLGRDRVAESQLGRFRSGIELLLMRHTKGPVRLTVRNAVEVRAVEEVMV